VTAPDRPERVDGVTDDTIKTEHAHKPNNQAGEHAANQLPAAPKLGADLRQQLADAISSKAHICYIECDCDGDHPILATTTTGDAESGPVVLAVEGSPGAIADALTAKVQPLLDAKDAEIDGFCEDLNDALNHNDKTCEAVKDRDRWQQRAENAEAETARLRAVHQQIGDQP
jgi:hypothetical protein